MKIKNLLFCPFGVVTLLFISCNDDLQSDLSPESAGLQIQTVVENKDFEVIDGYLKFKDSKSFQTVYESFADKSDTELQAWSTNNGYISLNDVYKKEEASIIVPERDLEPGEIISDISEKVKDWKYASLLNDKGMLLIQDTIYKVKGQYVYVISDGDFNKLNNLEQGADFTSLSSISRFEHTTNLTQTNRNYDRSPVYKVSRKRREHVEFNAWVSKIQGQGAQVIAEMTGQAQTKSLWWGINFEDEMVWGQVRFNSGSFNGKFGEATISQSWGKKTIGEKKAYGACGLGEAEFVNNVKLNVTFMFVKHANRGEESYTNNYSF